MNCIYLTITLEKRSFTFKEELYAMRNHYSIEEVPRDKEVVVRLNTTDMAILSFLVGVVLSLIAALIYKAFFTEPSHSQEVINNADSKNYANAVFTEETSVEDFNYPYEDIGDVIKEDSYVE